MTKRSRDAISEVLVPPGSSDHDGADEEELNGDGIKKPRTFMATLACDACRLKKVRCNEDRPK